MLSAISRNSFHFSKMLARPALVASKQTSYKSIFFSSSQADDATNEALSKLTLRDEKQKRLPSAALFEQLKEILGKENENFAIPQSAYNLLAKEYDSLLEENEEAQDKYRRALAETENVRRRGQKLADEAKVFAVQSFCKDLLEVADVLVLAIEAVKPDTLKANPELKGLHDGVVMTRTVLTKTFEKHGLKIVSPQGEKFDPNLHEAVFQIPKDQAKDVDPGCIGHVMKIGYSLHGRPIRPAQVGVVQG